MFLYIQYICIIFPRKMTSCTAVCFAIAFPKSPILSQTFSYSFSRLPASLLTKRDFYLEPVLVL